MDEVVNIYTDNNKDFIEAIYLAKSEGDISKEEARKLVREFFSLEE